MTNADMTAGIEAIRRIANALAGTNVPLAPPPKLPRGKSAALARDSLDVAGTSINGPLANHNATRAPAPSARDAREHRHATSLDQTLPRG